MFITSTRRRAGLVPVSRRCELVEAALVAIQRTEDLLPEGIDARGQAPVPVAVGAVGVERRRAAVDGEQSAGAHRVVDRAQRAEAELLDVG
jgi:hypothetical protein